MGNREKPLKLGIERLLCCFRRLIPVYRNREKPLKLGIESTFSFPHLLENLEAKQRKTPKTGD